ncbi:hypothetical protein JTB14_008497 [Gonioctena quinquepunctata]|nr:hypothetical protein JTB14_008497 [Gonioctena quinquepunctata]
MLSSLEREDGSMTGTWEESAKLLVNTLLPSDVHEGETAEQQEARRTMVQVYQEPPETILYPFTENEVEECMCTMKKKKAPGPDNITTEVLLALREKLIPALCVLYNECLRIGIIPKVFKQAEVVIISKGKDKDPSKAKSYRPICSLNSMGKLQEKLLCKRLKEHRETIGVHPDQYGYRSGRSTEDAINKALGIVDESENKYVVAIFIDISGAFDNLWWPAFFGRLREMQCPGALYKKKLQKLLLSRQVCESELSHGKNLQVSDERMSSRFSVWSGFLGH